MQLFYLTLMNWWSNDLWHWRLLQVGHLETFLQSIQSLLKGISDVSWLNLVELSKHKRLRSILEEVCAKESEWKIRRNIVDNVRPHRPNCINRLSPIKIQQKWFCKLFNIWFEAKDLLAKPYCPFWSIIIWTLHNNQCSKYSTNLKSIIITYI